MTPAIVVATHVIGLGVIRALGAMGVPIIAAYYDRYDMGYVSKFVYEKIRIPAPDVDETVFINYLLELGPKYHGSVLIPADDLPLLIIAKYKQRLQKYYKVACQDWLITETSLNKEKTYELAQKLGIPTPLTIPINSLKKLNDLKNGIIYPVLLKPSFSHKYNYHFKRKMTVIYNREQLFEHYKQVKEKDLDILLQEIIPGEDCLNVNYNCYMHKKEPIQEFTSQKVRLSPPEFGFPRIAKYKNIPEIIEQGRKLLKALDFEGYANIEFKKDERDGQYKLMEINARFNRSQLLSLKLGINYPWIVYNFLVNKQLSQSINVPNRRDTYWIDCFHDIARTIQYCRTEKYKISELLRPYISPHICSIFDRKDIIPFLKHWADLVLKLIKC